MVSSYCWKLKALLKKNLILMKRNILSTLFEIFFPIILMIVIIGLRKAFPVEIYTFEEEEKNLTNYIYNKSITTKNPLLSDTNYNQELNSWLGLTTFPPLQICSPINNQYQARPKIASIGIPQKIKKQMIKDSKEYESQIFFSLNESSFKEFNSIDELNEYIKDSKYSTNPDELICFGLKFNYDSKIKKYDYSLHFFDFDKTGKDGIQDIPSNKEKFFDDFFDAPFKSSFKSLPSNNLMRTDVRETEDGFNLEIDLPGYSKDEVKGEIRDGYLTISAFKSSEKEEKAEDGKYIRRERFSGNCSRSFYVGEDVTETDIKAKFTDGVLNLEIPKKEPVPKIPEKKLIAIEG